MLKKIIAREGLILIGLAVALYFALLVCRAVPVAIPKYRAQFADGKAYTIVIYPDINYSKALNSEVLLKEIHNPPPKIVSKRIEEFARQAKIDSKLISAGCVNAKQLYLSRIYSRIMSQPFAVKILFIYAFLVLMRFIIWAVKTIGG